WRAPPRRRERRALDSRGAAGRGGGPGFTARLIELRFLDVLRPVFDLETGHPHHVLHVRRDEDAVLRYGMCGDGSVEVLDALTFALQRGFDYSERLADIV